MNWSTVVSLRTESNRGRLALRVPGMLHFFAEAGPLFGRSIRLQGNIDLQHGSHHHRSQVADRQHFVVKPRTRAAVLLRVGTLGAAGWGVQERAKYGEAPR